MKASIILGRLFTKNNVCTKIETMRMPFLIYFFALYNNNNEKNTMIQYIQIISFLSLFISNSFIYARQ